MRGYFSRFVAGTATVVALTAPPAHADASDKGRCVAELARAELLSGDVNPKTANIITGTEGPDDLSSLLTNDLDVVCGFGGDDVILGVADHERDIARMTRSPWNFVAAS